MDPPKPDSDNTEQLLRQAQAGDGRAFEDLFARHRAYLHQVVALRLDPRMRPRIDASDVVQEAQLEAFRRFGDYLERRPMAFRLWLRKTTQERLLMLERFHRRAARRMDRVAPGALLRRGLRPGRLDAAPPDRSSRTPHPPRRLPGLGIGAARLAPRALADLRAALRKSSRMGDPANPRA